MEIPLVCRYLVMNQSIGQIKILTCWWPWRKSQGTTPVIIGHPKGNMNVWTKLQGNWANNYWHISLKTLRYQPHGGARQASDDHQSHKDSSSGNYEYLLKNMCTNPSSRCWDISQGRRKVSTAGGAQAKVKESGVILSESRKSVQNFTSNVFDSCLDT